MHAWCQIWDTVTAHVVHNLLLLARAEWVNLLILRRQPSLYHACSLFRSCCTQFPPFLISLNFIFLLQLKPLSQHSKTWASPFWWDCWVVRAAGSNAALWQLLYLRPGRGRAPPGSHPTRAPCLTATLIFVCINQFLEHPWQEWKLYSPPSLTPFIYR